MILGRTSCTPLHLGQILDRGAWTATRGTVPSQVAWATVERIVRRMAESRAAPLAVPRVRTSGYVACTTDTMDMHHRLNGGVPGPWFRLCHCRDLSSVQNENVGQHLYSSRLSQGCSHAFRRYGLPDELRRRERKVIQDFVRSWHGLLSRGPSGRPDELRNCDFWYL